MDTRWVRQAAPGAPILPAARPWCSWPPFPPPRTVELRHRPR